MLIPFVFLFACGGATRPSGQNDSQNQNNLTTGDQTVSGDFDPNTNFYLTFDLLGGVFRKNQASSAAMYLDTESAVAKSISTYPSTYLPTTNHQGNTQETPTESPQQDGLVVDYSRQYVGFENKGRMSLSVFGEGQEISPTNDPEDIVRHFSQLILRFVFHDFAFNNPCLGVVKLKGEITCVVAGDYEVSAEQFLGEAHCQNGPLDNPAPVIYKIPQKDFSAELNTHLTIDGDPYRYRSYSYEGLIVIDGEEFSVKDNIAKGASCSQP